MSQEVVSHDLSAVGLRINRTSIAGSYTVRSLLAFLAAISKCQYADPLTFHDSDGAARLNSNSSSSHNNPAHGSPLPLHRRPRRPRYRPGTQPLHLRRLGPRLHRAHKRSQQHSARRDRTKSRRGSHRGVLGWFAEEWHHLRSASWNSDSD